MNGFEPWVKNPDLTRSRLSTIASIIRNVRHEAVLLHEPQNGDDAWSLGCRAYARTRDAIKRSAGPYDWLKILPETTWLGFSSRLGLLHAASIVETRRNLPTITKARAMVRFTRFSSVSTSTKDFLPLTACSVSQSRLTEAVRF